MNKKAFVAAALIILIAGAAAVFWISNKNQQEAQEATDPLPKYGQPATTTAPVVQPATSTASGKLTWKLQQMDPTDPMSGPQTKVTLIAEDSGKTYDGGIQTGNCSVIEGSSWQLLEGEKTGVICWWAGGGTELGVFEENGKLLLKSGSLEEGTEETPGFRGNFKVLSQLN